jgi:hypothetical protein
LRISAPGENTAKAAMPLSGSRIDPAHDRKGVKAEGQLCVM